MARRSENITAKEKADQIDRFVSNWLRSCTPLRNQFDTERRTVAYKVTEEDCQRLRSLISGAFRFKAEVDNRDTSFA